MSRPIPTSTKFVLHTTLILGCLFFLTPFLWLILTSVKEDEELVPERLRILPTAPEPRQASPYVDGAYFSDMTAPDELPPANWVRLKPKLIDALRSAIATTEFMAELPIDQAGAVDALVPGLWKELLGRLPNTLWEDGDDAILAAVTKEASDATHAERAFDTIYRRACLGTPSVRDRGFVEYKSSSDWAVVAGDVTPSPAFRETDPRLRDLHYRFGDSNVIRLRNTFDAPVDPTLIKQITVPIRADRSCHRMHVTVSMKGKTYEAVKDFVLVGSRWTEVIFQEPSDDDDKPMQKDWTVIRESGSSAVTGSHVMVEVTLLRSGPVRAWWGKLSSNFDKVLTQVPFARYMWVSVFLACANIILTIFSSSLVAYAFARMEWPGKKIFFILLLSTLMIPPQVTMIPQFIIFRSLGWYNTLWPLWLPSMFGNAFFIFLLTQAMKGIPKDLTDAAKIDGCGFLRTYWYVVLPNVKAALAAVAIFTFMGSWNNFMGPLIYVNDQRYYNVALGLFTFQLQSGSSYSLLMAGTLLMIMPVLIIFFLAQRYFIQGVMMSGVKG